MYYLRRILDARTALLFSIALFLLIFSLNSRLLYADDLIHEVGRGETIYSISRFYSVNADELMRVNNITDPSRLMAGSRIIIPSTGEVASVPQQNIANYQVVRGDTLYGIARTHGITLQALLDMNGFPANYLLRVGETIRVPSGNTAAVSVTPPPSTAASSAAGQTGLYSLRWPVIPKDISYMTGQMGIVVEGELNESVKSMTAGNVISAGPWRKFGRMVIIESTEGYFYMYGGCETLSVSVGDRITPGMEVGRLGINTVSERPQLFFMVFRGDTPVDPASAPRAGDNART